MQQQLNRDYVFLSDGDQSVSTIKWYTSTIAKKNNKNKTKRIFGQTSTFMKVRDEEELYQLFKELTSMLCWTNKS